MRSFRAEKNFVARPICVPIQVKKACEAVKRKGHGSWSAVSLP